MITDEELFICGWELYAQNMSNNARAKGFYDTPRTFGDEIALAHTELSEAMEAFRHGNPPSEKIPAFTSIEEEMADLCIRVMETMWTRNMRLPQAILAKMAYNATREYRHGGKIL